MVTLTINVHLPLLRTTETLIPFARGTLWQMPWDTFNGLTSGAFEDHKQAYEATRPVFFNFELTADEPSWMTETATVTAGMVCEAKLPTNELRYKNDFATQYPFSIFHYVHDNIIDLVWELLILTCPTAKLVQPRHSITFINADDDVPFFQLGDSLTSWANFRGDADVEYIFMPEASGAPVNLETFTTAGQSFSINVLRSNASLSEALGALKTAHLPYLGDQQRLLLCTTALENLLIPGVYENISKTFSHRIATLQSPSPEQYAAKYQLSKLLYSERSNFIHGREGNEVSSLPAEAFTLLAECLVSLAQKTGEGQDLEQVTKHLDTISFPQTKQVAAAPCAVLNPSHNTLLHQKLRVTGTVVPGTRTGSPDNDILLFWSPLAAMETAMEIYIESFPATFTWLDTANSMMSLEDKDIRRDFMGKMRMENKPVAAIKLAYRIRSEDGDINEHSRIVHSFQFYRNLLVTGLRLAGFKHFVDPELLGIFMFKGESLRFRQPSVLRQSIYMNMMKEPAEVFDEKHVPYATKCWNLLAEFSRTAYSEDVVTLLDTYRNIHETQYMPLISRVSLSFTLIEKMLGGFRGRNESLQLENLVRCAIGDNEASAWFNRRARKMRNSIAHGEWNAAKNAEDYKHLTTVLDSLLPLMLKSWLVRSENASNFKDAFIKSITTPARGAAMEW